MTALLQAVLADLAVRVEGAARTGSPLRTPQPVALLRAAGVPRCQARGLIVTEGEGRWTVGHGQTTTRGGCPPQILLPVGVPVSGDLAAAETSPRDDPEPVDLRARLLRA